MQTPGNARMRVHQKRTSVRYVGLVSTDNCECDHKSLLINSNLII